MIWVWAIGAVSVGCAAFILASERKWTWPEVVAAALLCGLFWPLAIVATAAVGIRRIWRRRPQYIVREGCAVESRPKKPETF